jgi:hypothetical protein
MIHFRSDWKGPSGFSRTTLTLLSILALIGGRLDKTTNRIGKDLKDFGREAGSGVTFADLDRDVPGQGYGARSSRVLSFFTDCRLLAGFWNITL